MKFLKLTILLLYPLLATTQNAYQEGDRVKEMVFTKTLNAANTVTSLSNTKNAITILDFFGTWCAPCLKAIPELRNYQDKFKDDIRILLVSIESEAVLSAFITKNKPFPFPIVADTDENFSTLFQPPSYPYTVILDKNLKIIRITNAKDLTEAALEKWITENKQITTTKTASLPMDIKTPVEKKPTSGILPVMQLSQDLLYAAKTFSPPDTYIKALAELDYDSMRLQLKTDPEKITFWVNIYNAFTNIALHQNPSLYKKRNKFFKAKNIQIAHKIFSLDQIEHDILRRSSIKWSLGYFHKLFPAKTEKELRVHQVDWRIHFALNCGAKSCPPIAFYQTDKLNQQLDAATKNYLTGECIWNEQRTKLGVPVLFSWFRKDFGGKKNILPILKKYGIIEESDHPKIYFRKYNWDLYLENYQN